MPKLKCPKCDAKLLEEKYSMYRRQEDGLWYCGNCAEEFRNEAYAKRKAARENNVPSEPTES